MDKYDMAEEAYKRGYEEGRADWTVLFHAPHLIPMGARTYAVACALCRNQGAEFCNACKCEVEIHWEPDPEKLGRLMAQT